MVHQELERRFSLELLLTIQSALLSEYQAQSWFRNSLVKVLEWSENCLLWPGKTINKCCLLIFLILGSLLVGENT